eukprot:Em0019g1018a
MIATVGRDSREKVVGGLKVVQNGVMEGQKVEGIMLNTGCSRTMIRMDLVAKPEWSHRRRMKRRGGYGGYQSRVKKERTDCRGRERFKYRENAERCAGRNTGSYGSVKRHRLENEKTKEDSTTKEMEEESEHDIVIRPELWGCTFDSESGNHKAD